jgi:hypothetical protein
MSARSSRKDAMAARRSLKEVGGIERSRFLDTYRFEGGRADEVSLRKQRRTHDDDLAEFLTTVVKEWMVRNPGRSLDNTNLATILPEALDEFTWKHLGDC